MNSFQECAACAAKPGSPALCAACLHNRTTISKYEALLRRCELYFSKLAGHNAVVLEQEIHEALDHE